MYSLMLLPSESFFPWYQSVDLLIPRSFLSEWVMLRIARLNASGVLFVILGKGTLNNSPLFSLRINFAILDGLLK